MGHHIFDGVARGGQVGARVKLIGVFGKVLTDGGGDSQADVRIHIDFAHAHSCSPAQHVAEIVRPALESGQTVLCDRYTDSTLAYQGYGRGLDTEYLSRLNQAATGGLQPELTLLLDLPVRCGLMRAGERNRQEGLVVSEGRFDAESLDFHERVRQGFRALAEEEPERFAIIDAAQPPEDVVLQCRSALEGHLRQRGKGLE